MGLVPSGDDAKGEGAGFPEATHDDDPAEWLTVRDCLEDVDEGCGGEEDEEDGGEGGGGTVFPLVGGIGEGCGGIGISGGCGKWDLERSGVSRRQWEDIIVIEATILVAVAEALVEALETV